jgi:hypothetical protein
MVAIADGLAERGIATLRYQVPYMEQGSCGRTCRNLPKRRSRCSYSSIPSGPEACLRRRRHIVWGSYDITGTGRSLSRCISNARRKPTRVSSPSHREQGHCSQNDFELRYDRLTVDPASLHSRSAFGVAPLVRKQDNVNAGRQSNTKPWTCRANACQKPFNRYAASQAKGHD